MDVIRLDIERTAMERVSDDEARMRTAILGAMALTIVSLLLRFTVDAPLAPELLTQLIFRLAPLSVVAVAVGLLGAFAKNLAFILCVVGYTVAVASAGYLFLKLLPSAGMPRPRTSALAGFTAACWLATGGAVIPLLGGGFFGRYLEQGWFHTGITLFCSHFAMGLALWFGGRLQIDRRKAAPLERRRLVRGVAYLIVGVAAFDIARSLLGSLLSGESGRVTGGSGVFPYIDGLSREVTPTGDFYTVSKNPFDPVVDRARWVLRIGGLVDRDLTLSYDDLKALPSIEQHATLACIGNPVGGGLIGNAHWRGVRLRDLLESAGVKAGVVDIVLRASDGYADSIPLDRALSDGTMLAYEMNDEPLNKEHGFPVRLIVPGIYGMKNVKWITSIEAVDFDFKGYWQMRGWDDVAEYQTMSRIEVSRREASGSTVIAGIAFAGDRGVSRVEVSTDGGRSWADAEVRSALSAYSWVLWQFRWIPPAEGRYTILVRATDGVNQAQTPQKTPPAPFGATGYHRKTISAG